MSRNYTDSDIVLGTPAVRTHAVGPLPRRSAAARAEPRDAERRRPPVLRRRRGTGLDKYGMSYAAAYGDIDLDGDLDLVVANLNEPVSLYRNGAEGNWLKVRLRPRRGTRRGRQHRRGRDEVARHAGAIGEPVAGLGVDRRPGSPLRPRGRRDGRVDRRDLAGQPRPAARPDSGRRAPRDRRPGGRRAPSRWTRCSQPRLPGSDRDSCTSRSRTTTIASSRCFPASSPPSVLHGLGGRRR